MTERISSNVIRFPRESVTDIQQAAACWLARVVGGSMSLGEVAEFAYWRSENSEHDRIYRELEFMWDRLGSGSASSGLSRRARSSPEMSRRSSWARGLTQVAAALTGLMMFVQYQSSWRYDYHTAPGEMRRVALADGSTLFMKGNTALDANVHGLGPRTIDLARGEAFLEVRHDARRPFTVSVGNGTVQDIGTAFSVGRSGQSATVAVSEGEVAVRAGGLVDSLRAGQQLSFTLYDMGQKNPIDPAVISLWRKGLYVAQGKPLGDVLRDLDEYHAGKIIITSSGLAARRVNAVVQFDHIDAWLDALNSTGNVSVKRWGPLTIVSDLGG